MLNRTAKEVKSLRMRKTATIVTVLCASAFMAFAETEEEMRKRLELEFRRIPAPELPAYAATIVRNTPAAERSPAAVIVVETASGLRPAAASSVVAAISKAAPETRASLAAASTRQNPSPPPGNGNGNQSPGPGNGNANGGVGLGPGENKPGRPIVHDRPINVILPNGKPRHFPPDPPNRPVDPPRPHKYNKPHPNH